MATLAKDDTDSASGRVLCYMYVQRDLILIEMCYRDSTCMACTFRLESRTAVPNGVHVL